ncbi:MAG: energy transducer TonB, partial [Acidobacteria bacterium]|nr:energy transducer TonB [Acidobacteriota bacterium]
TAVVNGERLFGEATAAPVPGGTTDGVPYSIWTRLVPPPPPPPPVRTRVTKPRQIRVSHMEPAKLIYNPAPEYPPLAKMARIQGTVRLEAVIGVDGRIQNLKAISGHPLLVNAALEAVSRWRYQPTLLNGEPVEVLTEVDAIFHLRNSKAWVGARICASSPAKFGPGSAYCGLRGWGEFAGLEAPVFSASWAARSRTRRPLKSGRTFFIGAAGWVLPRRA